MVLLHQLKFLGVRSRYNLQRILSYFINLVAKKLFFRNLNYIQASCEADTIMFREKQHRIIESLSLIHI